MADTRDFASERPPESTSSAHNDTHPEDDHDHTDHSLTEKASYTDIEPAGETKSPRHSLGRVSRTRSHQDKARGTPTASASTARDDASSTFTNDTNPLEPLAMALSGAGHEVERLGSINRTRTAATGTSTWSRPPELEVTFEGDTARDFSLRYRMWIIFCVSYSTWVIVLYSTSYTSTISGLQDEFDQPNALVPTLGLTTYLLGLATGSVVVAPASELLGRRPVYLACMSLSALLVLPCALATSLASIIVVRFFGALFGAVMICNGAGTVADISTDDDRAWHMSLWSIAPLNGPVTGPLIGGFVFQYLGWRWDNWLVLILSGVAVLLMATVKETYAPVMLKQKAARRRKEEGDERLWCLYDDAQTSTMQLMKVNLSRPFVLSFTEPILWFFNIWISVIYGILYLCFVAYPIVFEDIRGWGPGVTGLSFIGIGIGTLIAIFMEPVWRRIINSHARDPETGRVPPEASASIMSIGAVLTPIGQLVFSWTCLPASIHYAIPIAFGIPFGCGNTLCFIYGSNYLAGAYGYYAASALAGNAVMRSIFGATLPLAGSSMYSALSPQWAGTLLGLLEVILVPIPFIFYRYGDRIRARSPVIKEMREEQAREDRKRVRYQEKKQKQGQVCSATAGAVGDDAVLEARGEGTTRGTGADEKRVDAVLESRDVEKANG